MSSLVIAAIIAAGLLAGAAQSAPPVPSERDQFVSVCLPRMSTRIQKQPETVCGCLHDHAVSKVEDSELRLAVIRGITETGVPSVQYSWVPSKTPEFVVETLDKVAAPTLACMFGPR
jgi:hypothetical protein